MSMRSVEQTRRLERIKLLQELGEMADSVLIAVHRGSRKSLTLLDQAALRNGINLMEQLRRQHAPVGGGINILLWRQPTPYTSREMAGFFGLGLPTVMRSDADRFFVALLWQLGQEMGDLLHGRRALADAQLLLTSMDHLSRISLGEVQTLTAGGVL